MNKKILISLSIILAIYFLIKINFPKNLFELVDINLDKRISNVYGFCEKEGIGYVNFIKKKFNIKEKLTLVNSLKKNNNNSGKWAIYDPKISENEVSKYLIIINLNSLKKKIDLNDYDIIHNFKDCYYLRRNCLKLFK